MPTPEGCCTMVFDHQYVAAALVVEVADHAGDTATATVAGEIDRDNYAQLEHALTDLLRVHRPRRVALDMAQVTFMGSEGIRVLLACRRQAEQVNSRIDIVRAHHRVREVLTLMNLERVLNLSADGAGEH
ncbi:STAS domain-containing protein [Actinoplanes sp. NPDC051633]|uniref:STAS domain-containing protein n=1 Tax=Actinoplanes sp. NPDC051633 TaxID=3155670 RepID=UPI0034124A03